MFRITKEFRDRILKEGIVDTDKYRYQYYDDGRSAVIRRLKIEYLDTTAALDSWEYEE